jgi:hypothetical protein
MLNRNACILQLTSWWWNFMARNMLKNFCEIKIITRMHVVGFNCNIFIKMHGIDNIKFVFQAKSVVSTAHVWTGGPATALPASLYGWTQQTAKLAVLVQTSQLACALARSFGSEMFHVGLPDGQVYETHLANISNLNSEIYRVLKPFLMSCCNVKCLLCQVKCNSGEEIMTAVEVTTERHYQTLSLQLIYLFVNKLKVSFHSWCASSPLC